MARSLTPYIIVKGAMRALDFYAAAFGARPSGVRYDNPDGTVGHAELTFGDGLLLYISDEAPELNVFSPETRGGATSSLVLEVDDPDATFARAVAAGARVDRPITEQPYGRSRWLIDLSATTGASTVRCLGRPNFRQSPPEAGWRREGPPE